MNILKRLRFWRGLSQVSVLLAFAVIPFLNWKGIHTLYGNFLSFNFGVFTVVDPMAALQASLGSLSLEAKTLPGAGLILLLALICGPLFCSWICPFGLFSELVHGTRLGGSSVRNRRASDAPAAKPPAPPAALKVTLTRPYKVKFLISALGLLGVLLFFPFPALNQLSMPGWYSRIMQHLVFYGQVPRLGLGLMLIVLALEKFLQKRLWCLYICPQSLLLNLCGLIIPQRLQVRFERKKCTCAAKDRLCGKVCSLNLDPRSALTAQRLQCTNCGDCVDACAGRGKALSLGFGKKA